MRGAPRFAAAPVANSISVSLVDVSLSTVTALNVPPTAFDKQRLQDRRVDRRIGRDEGQHRRHVRRDHAGALGDAIDVTSASPSFTVAVATFG